MPTARSFSDQLRDAIRDSGFPVRELGERSGVDDGVIHRFLNEQRGLTTGTVDKLTEALGLRLTEGRRPAATRAKVKAK